MWLELSDAQARLPTATTKRELLLSDHSNKNLRIDFKWPDRSSSSAGVKEKRSIWHQDISAESEEDVAPHRKITMLLPQESGKDAK